MSSANEPEELWLKTKKEPELLAFPFPQYGHFLQFTELE